MRSISFLVILCSLLSVGEFYKILGIFPIGSKSHYYIGHALLEGLAEDGHDVTIISPFEAKNQHKNYKQILLESTYELMRKSKIAI